MSEEQEAVAEVSSVTETDEKPTAEEASPEEEKSEQESETTVNENETVESNEQDNEKISGQRSEDVTANESGTIERECGTVDEGQSTNEVAVTEGVNTSTEVVGVEDVCEGGEDRESGEVGDETDGERDEGVVGVGSIGEEGVVTSEEVGVVTSEDVDVTTSENMGVVNNGEEGAVNEGDVGVVNDGDVGVVSNGEEGVVSTEGGLVSASRAPLENITEQEEEEEEDDIDRDELIDKSREALQHQDKLRRDNEQLQHKIAEYLSHKKEEKSDPGRNVTDQEKRYLQCMGALGRLEVELEHARSLWTEKEDETKELSILKENEVNNKTDEFFKYQEDGGSQSVDRHTGRRITSNDIKRLQDAQRASDQSVYQARLENIKLANKIERMETLLKQKEELAEGLHMMDFEQLKISNIDLAEKVEERNEEIRKLTSKVRATVQVLTHVKEKLHFLQGENEKKKNHLQQLDSDLAKRREVLTKLKQTRDSLRLDNHHLRQRGGLVSHPDLLRDFEDRQDENMDLQAELVRLQCQHTQNTVECTGLRRKIEHTTQLQQHLH